MISLIIFWLPTIIAAWVGWRWRRWWGVLLAVLVLWAFFFMIGFFMLIAMGPNLKSLLESYPAPS